MTGVRVPSACSITEATLRLRRPKPAPPTHMIDNLTFSSVVNQSNSGKRFV
jgi:hypothetical protein